MNDYISNYEKSIKYSLLPQKDHIINLIHNDSGNAPIHADMLEEGEHHFDEESLNHLRNHSGPFKVEKKAGKIKVRAVRPVYHHLAFLENEDNHEFPHELVENANTPEGKDILVNHILQQYFNAGVPPHLHGIDGEPSSESAAGRSDNIIHHKDYIISHNPQMGYIGLEKISHVPVDQYEKIKKLTEERLSR